MLKRILFSNSKHSLAGDLGLLLFRVFISLSMLTHGYPKLMNIVEGKLNFPDPIGLGSTLSLYLVVFAEFFAVFFVALGLLTRFATFPVIFAMIVAAFIFHASDPYSAKEMALLYLSGNLLIMIAGPGRFSLDSLIYKGAK